MDKPTDMKLTKSDIKDREKGDYPVSIGGSGPSGPKYPWGLTLRLDKTALEKLGMTKDLPDVGVLCQVIGVGRIISVSERENQSGTDCDVEVQIEKLNLEVEDEEAAFVQGAKKGRSRGRY